MNMTFSQSGRAAVIHSTLGPEALALTRLDGLEHVNDLFLYAIDVIAKEERIDLGRLIGTHLTVELQSSDAEPQFFDGIITQARWTGRVDAHATARLTLEPWTALLRHRVHHRIFHNASVGDILSEVFAPDAALGNPIYSNTLSESYEPLEYTVQYGESDLVFVRRLMERFGISFHYEHGVDTHTMVLTDNAAGFGEISGGTRDLIDVQDGVRGDAECFTRWEPERQMTTGAVRLTDFNFETPSAQMEAEKIGEADFENGGLESYDYPGLYASRPAGDQRAKLLLEQHRMADDVHSAEGTVISMRAGRAVRLAGQAADELIGKDYLCLSAHHIYEAGDVVRTMGEGGRYDGRYTLMPKTLPCRPVAKTPRAVVHGPQTAWVVGEGEIDCDAYGRILVQFHWDLARANSMRCRVSQNWSGNGWGGMVVPRVGMEVVVEFLEGDPDKPLVTGCVYNAKNAVPYALPQHKTRSTFRTKTHQGNGFNELRFEDKSGAEEIFLHASKDMNTKIERNATERIDECQLTSVGLNRGTEIGNNDSEVVVGDKILLIGPSNRGRFTPVTASEDTQGIGGAIAALEGSPTGQGNFAMEVEGRRVSAIRGSDSLEVGMARTETIGTRKQVRVGADYVLEAADSITLKCGLSSLVLEKSGKISLNGRVIDLEASNLAKVKAAAIKLN